MAAGTARELYKFPGQYEYDGMQLGSAFSPQVLDKVKRFQLCPDDILIAAYPKSGE